MSYHPESLPETGEPFDLETEMEKWEFNEKDRATDDAWTVYNASIDVALMRVAFNSSLEDARLLASALSRDYLFTESK